MLILPKSSSRLMFHSLIGGFKSWFGRTTCTTCSESPKFLFSRFFSLQRSPPFRVGRGGSVVKTFCFLGLYKDFCVKLYKERIYFVSVVSGCKSSCPPPPQRGPGIAGGATGATVPPTAALAAAFCFSIVQSNV